MRPKPIPNLDKVYQEKGDRVGLNLLELFQQSERPAFLYRDRIYLLPTGNHLVSETLCESLKRLSNKSTN